MLCTAAEALISVFACTPYIEGMDDFEISQQNLFGGLVCNTTRERPPMPFESLLPGQRYLIKEVVRADNVAGSLKVFQTRDGFEHVRIGKYGQLICTKYLDRTGRVIRVDSASIFAPANNMRHEQKF